MNFSAAAGSAGAPETATRTKWAASIKAFYFPALKPDGTLRLSPPTNFFNSEEE
jgi:hypothetical protein